jgi:large subunit ribosomal protein L3
MFGLIGRKVGMTRIPDAETGVIIPVSVVQIDKNVVLQVKTLENDGYEAAQVGFDFVERRGTPIGKDGKPVAVEYQKSKSGKVVEARKYKGSQTNAEVCHALKYGSQPVRHIKEFAIEEGEKVESGQIIGVENFRGVRFVDVTGTTKGRGFTGTVKRYQFRLGRHTHGNTNYRDRGSLGAGTYPARVFPGLKMAGQFGNKKKTIRGCELVGIDEDKGVLFVKGSIPGKTNGLVFVRKNLVKA